ncbi:EpsG family protein [Staphylococcus sp. IVB6181]|uniref:EpsG family protein n=1 Tax=Staphylococcus sp. IVB6181 TaxID=2929481 RepID=UPI0021D0DA3D|nr:EpsG family protein [Staphylococcus sp. IVB6181]
MIFITLTLILLLIVIYLSHIQLSKGIAFCIYMIFTANLFYVLFEKQITSATDYEAYQIAFEDIKDTDFVHIFTLDIFEPLFRIIAWLLLQGFQEYTFIIIVVIINLLIAIGIYHFYDDKNLALFALIFYTYSPIYLTMSTNIIRHLLVISLVIVMFHFKKWKKLWFLLLPLIHTSSILIVPILMLSRYIRVRFAFISFGLSILLFLTGINQKIFGQLSIFKEYTSAQFYYLSGSSGNRLDFLVFTILIVILGLGLYLTKIITADLMKYLLLSGTEFGLFGFQAFSDRIAIYNWCFLIVLAPYMLVLIKKNIVFSKDYK